MHLSAVPEGPDQVTGVHVSVGDVLAVLAGLVGVVGSCVLAVAWLTSKWRKANEKELEGYARTLKEQRDEARADLQATQQKYEEVLQRVAGQDGKIALLQDIILRQCRSFVADATTGGCHHCTLGLAYGQQRSP